jgi:hypothetical protein
MQTSFINVIYIGPWVASKENLSLCGFKFKFKLTSARTLKRRKSWKRLIKECPNIKTFVAILFKVLNAKMHQNMLHNNLCRYLGHDQKNWNYQRFFTQCWYKPSNHNKYLHQSIFLLSIHMKRRKHNFKLIKILKIALN